jgi:hypothetical protein
MSRDDIHSMNINDLLRYIAGRCNSICALLVKANKTLTSGKLDQIDSILQQQSELLKDIKSAEDIVLKNTQILEEANKKYVQETKAAYDKMHKLMVKTETNVSIGLRIGKQLLERISHNTTEQRKQELGYNKSGRLPSKAELEKNMPSISLISKT